MSSSEEQIVEATGTPIAYSYKLRSREDAEMWCDRCERRHGVIWIAPSDLWNAVMREGDRGKSDEFNFCCPVCFMQLANERGIGNVMWDVRTWEPASEPPASVPSPPEPACKCGHTAYWHSHDGKGDCEGSNIVAPGSFVPCECQTFAEQSSPGQAG